MCIRDRLLHRGVCGHGSVWEFASGGDGACGGRSAHGDVERGLLHLGRDLVRHAAEIDTKINSADLRESWNFAGAGECRNSR